MSIIEENLREDYIAKIAGITLQQLGNSSGYESNSEDDEGDKTMGFKQTARFMISAKRKSKTKGGIRSKDRSEQIKNGKINLFTSEVTILLNIGPRRSLR
jgi:hypothetical protein